MGKDVFTIDTCVIGLHIRLLYFAILHYQSIPLASIITEDGSTIEGQIQSFGELGIWITKEANLQA